MYGRKIDDLKGHAKSQQSLHYNIRHMTPVKTPPSAQRLTRDAWLDAAFRAVVEAGFDNIRVLVLADKLGVTRGSFYWHFADHAELVSALLTRWREHEQEQNLRLRTDLLADPRADLEHLLEAALSQAGEDLENMRFELALRGLGRRDTAVASMLTEVDQTRMHLFESKFQRLTNDSKKASELASLFYLALVGSFQALSRPANSPQLKNHLKNIIATYLIQQQAL
ncbi:TetR/AcrR family transcriptional regulator [Undibacterium parvum]|uniref:TetR/AcrR family transcriptional regulator n=1 Tax=Undibacterium parvum TaxID=401471 RepID=A0A3S9HN13_9BURK|nr:TetR/AcrR family transcriptional regulator [Undibacterium parvum]AZP13503.1 TetR/AcrR family transcriptional regulator [Undibacterium parvum]